MKKIKGKCIYIALFLYCTGVPHTQGAQAWITQFYLQLHACFYLVNVHHTALSCQYICAIVLILFALSWLINVQQFTKFLRFRYSSENFTH